MPLNFRKFKWFRFSATPNAQIVIGNGRMKVRGHVHVLEITLPSRITKLSMVPIHYVYTVRFTFAQIVGQIVSDTGPEKRRNTTNRWQMVLVNVVQHFVVQ